MSLLAPFEVRESDKYDLIEILKEECDTFFHGNSFPKLSFTGIDIFEHKRKKILFLNPFYDPDLEYCSEMIKDICKDYVPKQIKYKDNKKQFLPLGTFVNENELCEDNVTPLKK